MPVISNYDKAYNSVIAELNAKEKQVMELLTARNRLWEAAEALHPLGAHGKGWLSQKRIRISNQ